MSNLIGVAGLKYEKGHVGKLWGFRNIVSD